MNYSFEDGEENWIRDAVNANAEYAIVEGGVHGDLAARVSVSAVWNNGDAKWAPLPIPPEKLEGERTYLIEFSYKSTQALNLIPMIKHLSSHIDYKWLAWAEPSPHQWKTLSFEYTAPLDIWEFSPRLVAKDIGVVYIDNVIVRLIDGDEDHPEPEENSDEGYCPEGTTDSNGDGKSWANGANCIMRP